MHIRSLESHTVGVTSLVHWPLPPLQATHSLHTDLSLTPRRYYILSICMLTVPIQPISNQRKEQEWLSYAPSGLSSNNHSGVIWRITGKSLLQWEGRDIIRSRSGRNWKVRQHIPYRIWQNYSPVRKMWVKTKKVVCVTLRNYKIAARQSRCLETSICNLAATCSAKLRSPRQWPSGDPHWDLLTPSYVRGASR